MKLMFRALLNFATLVLTAHAAYSCTCLQTAHRKEFRQSDANFAGRVTEIREDASYIPPKLKVSLNLQKMLDSTKRYLVRFKVEQKFKGVEGKEIVVDAYQSNSPCSGMEFLKGESYLIYADRKDGRLTGGALCSRTRKLDRTSKEYKELNSFWFRFRSRFPWLS